MNPITWNNVEDGILGKTSEKSGSMTFLAQVYGLEV